VVVGNVIEIYQTANDIVFEPTLVDTVFAKRDKLKFAGS